MLTSVKSKNFTLLQFLMSKKVYRKFFQGNLKQLESILSCCFCLILQKLTNIFKHKNINASLFNTQILKQCEFSKFNLNSKLPQHSHQWVAVNLLLKDLEVEPFGGFPWMQNVLDCFQGWFWMLPGCLHYHSQLRLYRQIDVNK